MFRLHSLVILFAKVGKRKSLCYYLLSFFSQIFLKYGVNGALRVIFAIFDVARVMLEYLAAEHTAIDVGIDFGGADALMSEHTLNGAEVGATLEKVGGKRVAEGVGADGLLQPDAGGQLFDDMENHDAGDIFAEAGDEDEIFVTGLDAGKVAVGEIEIELLDGAGGDRDEALFAALALHADEAFGKVEVRELKVAKFGDSKTTTIKRLENGAVSLTLGSAAVDAGDEAVNLLHSEHLGQVEAYLGGLEQFGGVGIKVIVEHEESIEGTDAREDARLRTRMDTDVAQTGRKGLKIGCGDIEHGDALESEIGQQFVEVSKIGIDGVG